MKNIMTVNGLIDSKLIGLTLPHEHIMVDFKPIVERNTEKRYDSDDVINIMLPYLMDIKNKGVATFVDCTPMYLGRDAMILRELSNKTGINIITNTGMYKEPFLSKLAFETSAEVLAQMWINESENGIDGTDVKPGFIKTAVFSDKLKPIQQKIIRAAAITSKNTGLVIATHSESAISAMDVIRILDDEKIDPSKWIYVHVQAEDDNNKILDVAKEGVWMELDGISPSSIERHIELLVLLLEKGYKDRILLSHDAGWYNVGEESGGKQNPYTHIFDLFIPTAIEMGISKEIIDDIMIKNPSRALAIGK